MDYKIIGLKDHNIMLEYDGFRRNFPLPVNDGVYPVGADLDALLSGYVSNARAAAEQQSTVKAGNEDVVMALVQPPTLSAAEARAKRRNLLVQSDWTQLADSTATDNSAWLSYRQALRDVPSQTGFPTSIMWPVAPTAPVRPAVVDPDAPVPPVAP